MMTGTDEKIDLVLVAEHQFPMRLLAREILEQSGSSVMEADNGEAVVDFCTRRHPDAINREGVRHG